MLDVVDIVNIAAIIRIGYFVVIRAVLAVIAACTTLSIHTGYRRLTVARGLVR
jgi:hypothetical protein